MDKESQAFVNKKFDATSGALGTKKFKAQVKASKQPNVNQYQRFTKPNPLAGEKKLDGTPEPDEIEMVRYLKLLSDSMKALKISGKLDSCVTSTSNISAPSTPVNGEIFNT